MQQKNSDRWLRVPVIADRLGIGLSTAYELVQRGELVAIKIGRAVRVSQASYEDFIKRQIDTFGEQ